MPASMMRAPTGSSPKVIGSSMAIVAIGPTPGSTPISVPTMQPRKQRARFWSDRATPNPSARFENMSSMALPSDMNEAGDDEDWDRQVQKIAEQADAEGRHHRSKDQDLAFAHLGRCEPTDDH